MLSGLPIHFEFDVKGTVRQWPYQTEANLFLIAREAVSNALNHASPKRIRLELSYTAKGLRVTIEDDGAGFDPKKALAKTGHWGFRGMRERARQIGANFEVDTAPARGAQIVVGVRWKS